jgi:hypothetical protein
MVECIRTPTASEKGFTLLGNMLGGNWNRVGHNLKITGNASYVSLTRQYFWLHGIQSNCHRVKTTTPLQHHHFQFIGMDSLDCHV